MKSLRVRLLLWNGFFFLTSLLMFGFGLVWLGTSSAQRGLDQILIRRADDYGHRPRLGGPGGQGGPGGGMGQPGQPGQPGGYGQMIPPNGPPRDFRAPRSFGLDGEQLGPFPPFLPKLIPETRKGRTLYGDFRTNDGIQLRVISRLVGHEDGTQEIVQVAMESDSLRLASEGQQLALKIALPVVILASLWLAIVLSRFVMRPVGRLTEAAEAISADPKRRDRIEVVGDDEMARLSGTFNRMTDRLQSALDTSESLLEQQRRFTSDVAHELRTPLAGISLAAENGLHPDATLGEARRSLELVRQNGETMRKLTEMLLTLARLDAAKAKLPVSAVRLRPVVEDAARELGLSEDPRLNLQVPDDSEALANRDALRQVVRNLLENAAAYTPQDGVIRVSAAGRQMVVFNTGEGIPAEHLPHVFERFYRVDPSRTRAHGGSGLGLAIVQELCRAMQATVSAASIAGQSVTFCVEFAETSQQTHKPVVE